MFWRVAGYTQPSPLEAILDKDHCTLEEVLEEDDLIQECKALNGRLINFLKRRESLQRMLHYLADQPPEGGPTSASSWQGNGGGGLPLLLGWCRCSM